MTGEADAADHVRPLRLGLHAGELDAVIDLLHRDAIERAEEVEVPPGVAELPVGCELQPAFFLPGDDLLDLDVLDRLQRLGADCAVLTLRTRLLDGRRAQEAADVIGTERRSGALHVISLPFFVERMANGEWRMVSSEW